MSLLGLSLAIGILIDDAIGRPRELVRHVEQGKTTTRRARRHVGDRLAVAATTFSIVVVFVPIAFMGGIAQQWMAPFALTIACSVLVSLFVSFSLDPMLSAYWPDPHRRWRPLVHLARLARLQHWFNRQADRYKRVIGWALRHRFAMVVLAIGTFCRRARHAARWAPGGEFFPCRTSRSSIVQSKRRRIESRLHAQEAEESGDAARERSRASRTRTPRSAATGAVDEGTDLRRAVPEGAAHDASGANRGRAARELQGDRRRHASVPRAAVSTIRSRFRCRSADRKRGTVRLADRVCATCAACPAPWTSVSRRAVRNLSSTCTSIARCRVARRPRRRRRAGAAAGVCAGVDAGDWTDPTGKTRDVTVRLAPEARPAAPATWPICRLVVRDVQGRPVTTAARSDRDEFAHSWDRRASITSNRSRREYPCKPNTQARPVDGKSSATSTRRSRRSRCRPGYTITQGGETEEQTKVFPRIFVALGVRRDADVPRASSSSSDRSSIRFAIMLVTAALAHRASSAR
jgi:hypothetical protein